MTGQRKLDGVSTDAAKRVNDCVRLTPVGYVLGYLLRRHREPRLWKREHVVENFGRKDSTSLGTIDYRY